MIHLECQDLEFLKREDIGSYALRRHVRDLIQDAVQLRINVDHVNTHTGEFRVIIQGKLPESTMTFIN